MKLVGAVCVLLFAGVIASTQVLDLEVGQNHSLNILAFPNDIAKCVLSTPADSSLEFVPGVTSSHGDRFELQPITSLAACTILVKNFQSSDAGLWKISYESTEGVSASASYQINIKEAETGATESSTDSCTRFNIMNFPTRSNATVDISLPYVDYGKECYIRTPKGEIYNILDTKVEGVTVHDSSTSPFVSCRITIGPMTEDLLGNWTICGKHMQSDHVKEICQPAYLYWGSIGNPEATWHVDIKEKFMHPVHLDSILSPSVVGNGDVIACHIITDYMEDLLVNPDSKFPGIHVTISDSTCRFDIGPIDTNMLGDWIIYGLFTNFVEGVHEVRHQFSTFLYDIEDPYNQAYNKTTLNPVIRAAQMGSQLIIEVTGSGQVDSCLFEAPNGLVSTTEYQENIEGVLFVQDDSIACKVAIGPITKELLGNWIIIGKFNNKGSFTEIKQEILIVLEDPENPLEEDRDIKDLDAQSVDSKIGSRNIFVINFNDFVYGESCHIRTPKGLQYQLSEGFDRISGVEFFQNSEVECGVIITVTSEAEAGNWTLIGRATHHSKPIERRLPLTIYIEESAEAYQDKIMLEEGEDLYVSLKRPTENHETCKLIGPFGFECQAAVKNPEQVNTCGFIRKDVKSFNAGIWTIIYRDTTNFMVYKAQIHVTVATENPLPEDSSTLTLEMGSSVAKYVGPASSYCRLEDPTGVIYFDGFGKCHLTIDHVGPEHQGVWSMLVTQSGEMIAKEQPLAINVTVPAQESRFVATTYVAQSAVTVELSCSAQAAVSGCKFRDPRGNILIAVSGLAEGRYSFYGAGDSARNGVYECGIRITEPETSDLGMWRCALETAAETYYGHLEVLPSWVAQPVDANVNKKPTLTANRQSVTTMEHRPAVLSCSIEASIHYCYFRVSNGTTYSVYPGMSSSSMEYVGAGFEAGECGVRLTNPHEVDSGSWSCHVGLNTDTQEHTDYIQLSVREYLSVNHQIDYNGETMIVQGIAHAAPLEYCRFVRSDGTGFNNENVPSPYKFTGSLADGQCQLTIDNPSDWELRPWTIAARVEGTTEEIVKDTSEFDLIDTGADSDNTPNPPQTIIIYRNNFAATFIYVFLGLVLMSLIIGGISKSNRQWTAERVTVVRRSFSNRFGKQTQQLPTNQPAPQYTP